MKPIKSGLNIPEWRTLLVDYHDKEVVDFLEYGWPDDYTADKPPTSTTTNHANSTQYENTSQLSSNTVPC